MTWIALLRGINLGKAKRIAMSDLRDLLEGLGYKDVRTLLQSGNALFTSARNAATLEGQIEKVIESKLGMDVKVLVRSTEEFESVFRNNPFVKRKVDPKQLGAAFLSVEPDARKLAAIERSALLPDEFEVGERVLYIRTPNGGAGSNLPDWGKVLSISVTVRNWNTVTRLHELLSAV